MVFLLYFKNQQEAEKATLYEKFNEKIIKKYDDNFLKIELADDGRNPSEIVKDFLNKVYSEDFQKRNFVSPEYKQHIPEKLSPVLRATVWDGSGYSEVPL